MSGSAGVWLSRSAPWTAILGTGAALALALAVALLPLTWAVLLVLAGIAVLLTLVRPQFALLLIIPAVPFGSVRQVQVGGMNVGALEALVALVLGAWFMRMVARHELRIKMPWLTVPLLVFLSALVLSLWVTTSLQSSLKEILKWVEVLGLYLLVINEADERWMKALVFVLMGTGAAAALLGIYQFFFRVGPEGFVLFGRFMRAYGTFDQPNPYGGYLGLTLPVAMGVLVAGRRAGWPLSWAGRNTSGEAALLTHAGKQSVASTGASLALQETVRNASPLFRLYAAACGALMLAALIMSWSRGAWLGFAAAVVVMMCALVWRSSRAMVAITVCVLLVALILWAGGLVRVPTSISQRFGDWLPYLGIADVRNVEITDANFAVVERMAHWQSAWAMWTDHPWLGVGIGNYEVVYPRYALPAWPVALGHAHNYYLNIAAETGVLGLAAYVLLWGVALVGAWRAARWADGWQAGLALGILGVLVHLSVHNVVDDLFVHGMYLQVAILLGFVPLLLRTGLAQQSATWVKGATA